MGGEGTAFPSLLPPIELGDGSLPLKGGVDGEIIKIKRKYYLN
jgi:hypothetical protein